MSVMRASVSRKSNRYTESCAGEVALEIAQAFGSRCGSGLRDAAAFADPAGQHLLQIVGRYASFRHASRSEASFVIESPQVMTISACALSRSRAVLAVSELCTGATQLPSLTPTPSAPSSPSRSPARGRGGSGFAGSPRGSTTPLSPATAAAAEVQAGDLRCQVTLYNLKVAATAERQPLRTLQDIGRVGLVVAAALSGDAEATLLAVASETIVAVLDWRRNEVLGRFEQSFAVTRLTLSPSTPEVLGATGPGGLRLWALARRPSAADEPGDAQALQALPDGAAAAIEAACESPRDGLLVLEPPEGLGDVRTHFTDHAWMEPADGTLAVSSEHGSVHLLQVKAGSESRLLRTIVPFQLTSGQEVVPRTLRAFSGGLLIGGDDGALALWELTGSALELGERQTLADLLEHVRSAPALPGSKGPTVTAVDLATQGGEGCDQLLLGFADNSVGLLMLDDFRLGKSPIDGSEAHCKLLCGGASPGPVASLDLAAQRPVLASACRQECAVRLWNYSTNQCELKWSFPGEEPTCVSLHPLGFLLAVGFGDRFRVMQVLADELKLFREVALRGVRTLKFSHGGHLLAVAHAKTVVVYGARTFSRAAKLQHSQQVISISFHPDDRLVTTCSEDGSVVEWSTSTWSKVNEHCADRDSGSEAFSVAAAGSDHPTCVAVLHGTQAELRFYEGCRLVDDDGQDFQEGIQLTSVCQFEGPAGPVIFAGLSTGALYYRFQIGCRLVEKELPLHSGPCLDVRISPDGSTLVTAGEDGVIFVLNVQGLSAQGEDRAGGLSGDVVMISRGELQGREEEIQRLAAEAASLKVQLVEESARMQTECQRRVAEARKQDQDEIKTLRGVCEVLQAQATAQEREALREMKAMEAAHVKAADQLEADYDRESLRAADHYRAMEAELVLLAEQLVNFREESIRRVEAERVAQRELVEKAIEQKDDEVRRIKELVEFSRHRFNTMLDQEAMEQELEREQLLGQSEAAVERQRDVEYKLKKEQDTMLRGLEMMEKDRARAAQEQLETDYAVKSLTEQVDKLQAQVDLLKQERRDREASLRDKELEIGSYKVKVSTLKKFKHVLDFRLREVTLSLQPKDDAISELGGKLKDLEEEFERNLEVQKQMQGRLRDVDEEIKEKQDECERLREVIRAREREIAQFAEDLRNLATKEQDVRQWPAGMRAIAKKHVKPERLSRDYGGEAMQELLRQIDGTERKAERLSSQGRAASEEWSGKLRKSVEENFELIRELEKLRKERKELNMQVKEFELKVQNAEKRRAELAARQSTVPALTGGTMLGLEDRGPAAFSTSAPDGFFSGAAAGQVGGRSLKPSGSAGTLRKSGVAHRSQGERQAMQKLLAAADLRNQQVQFQALEHKLLKDQLEHLQSAAAGGDGAAAGAKPAAGAALSAVRRAADRS